MPRHHIAQWRQHLPNDARRCLEGGLVHGDDEVVQWLSESILPHEASFEGLKTALRHRYRTLKIEPPTAARIERLARSARQAYSDKFSNQIHNRLSDAMKRKLDNLLERPTDEKGNQVGYSTFATLKRDAGKGSLKNILAEIDKLTQILDALPKNQAPRRVDFSRDLRGGPQVECDILFDTLSMKELDALMLKVDTKCPGVVLMRIHVDRVRRTRKEATSSFGKDLAVRAWIQFGCRSLHSLSGSSEL